MSGSEEQDSTGYGSQDLSQIRGNASSQFIQSNSDMTTSDNDDDDEESMTKFRQQKVEEESSSNDDDDESLAGGFSPSAPLFKDFSEDSSSYIPPDTTDSDTDNQRKFETIDEIQLAELQRIAKENVGQHKMSRKALPVKESFSQTREKTDQMYKNLYSKLGSKSQGVIPPASGKVSTDRVVVKALRNDLLGSKDDEDGDNTYIRSYSQNQRPEGKQSNYRIRYCSQTKPNVVPPPPSNFYKKQAFWTGSEFTGEFEEGEMFLGVFKYPTGSVYESEFLNGQIHSGKHIGRIKFPRGDIFEGQWVKGRLTSGKVTFYDGLEYSDTNWDYLSSGDKRLHSERTEGFSKSKYNLKSDPVKKNDKSNIPYGCYDESVGNFLPSRIPGSSVLDRNPKCAL